MSISSARRLLVLVSLTVGACTTGSKPETSQSQLERAPVAQKAPPAPHSAEVAAHEASHLPTWEDPFAGVLNFEDEGSARCLLVVDSTANGNHEMASRNEASAQGIFEALKPSEQKRLLTKAWTVIPIENSLYGERAVQAWAAKQNYPGIPSSYDDLRPEDQVRYLKDVVDPHYRRLHRVQVIRLLTRPSALHTSFYSPKHKWKTNGLGLFVTQDSGEQSIYRVGLVDFKDDPRWAWPRAESFSDSIKYEKTSQLQNPDWERVAQLENTRGPSAVEGLTAKEKERDRVEVAIHLSQVENFIYFLPQCAPQD